MTIILLTAGPKYICAMSLQQLSLKRHKVNCCREVTMEIALWEIQELVGTGLRDDQSLYTIYYLVECCKPGHKDSFLLDACLNQIC